MIICCFFQLYTIRKSMASSARTKNEEEEIVWKSNGVLSKTKTKLSRVERELRIAKILNEELTGELRAVRTELVDTQRKLYTMRKKQERVLEYTKWLEMYKSEGIVSAKYIFIINTNKNMERKA